MSEDRKGFTVNDRRHFRADGELRSQEPEESTVPVPAPVVEPEVVAAPISPPEAPERPRSRPKAGPAMGQAIALSDLLVQFAGSASVLLGLGAPEGETPEIDLDGAREVIGILEMLRDKTEGRRTPEEDALIDGILYELHLSYVARSRPGGV
jgi:Domain of unknown function (DUF1844)